MKAYLKQHENGKDAVNRTKQNNVIAVMVKTYNLDSLVNKEYYSYKTKWNYDENIPLSEDFPLSLGSNQSIEEIDANYF